MIDIPHGGAVLAASRALSSGQFIANEPDCYIIGAGNAVLTVYSPSNILALNKIVDSTCTKDQSTPEHTSDNVDDVSGFFDVLRPYVSRYTLVQQRHYSGETKYYDNTIKVSSLPGRAIIFPQCRRLEIGAKEYSIEQPSLSMPATISDVSYVDENTVTFTDKTSNAFVGTGDLLYWQVKLPVLDGDPEKTATAMGLMVTDVRQKAVTCRILSDVDTAYSPSSVDVYIQRFVSPARYFASTTSGRATVTMTDTRHLRVGDWLTSESHELPRLLRIVDISGGTVTMHQTLNRTLSSVEVFNSKLHNLTPVIASADWDPPDLAKGASTTKAVRVDGSRVGDRVMVSFSKPLSGLQLGGSIESNGTAVCVLSNTTGGNVNLNAGVLRVETRN